MNTSSVRAGLSARLGEARELLSHIRAAEQPLQPLPPLAAVLRGYVYVTCYGCIEFAVTEGTQLFINGLRTMGVQVGHLELSLNSIALHGELSSLEDSGGRRKWKERTQLFVRLGDGSACGVDDTVFGALLHNVGYGTLEDIFRTLAINKPPVQAPRERGYLDTLKNRRNAVAHGREVASDVGDGQTSAELENILNVTHSVATYFLDSLEEHVRGRSFIRSEFRSRYL